MNTVKLLIVSTILTIIPGQLIRINVSENAAVNLTDLFVAVTCFYFFINFLFKKIKIILPGFIFPFGILFIVTAGASTILSFNYFSPRDVLFSSFFLLRLALYTSFGLVVVNTLKKQASTGYVKLVIIAGSVFTLIGYLQMVFYPNLTSLTVYGWDPHINRLVSTTLDPNFTGGFIMILTSLSASYFLSTKKNIYLFLMVFFSSALVLTFSRSAYVAFLASMLVVSAVKSPKMILVPVTILTLSVALIPATRQRVAGALTIDQTSLARIESWKNALVIIKDYPLFGVGFNNYRNIQKQYGFFDMTEENGGHSGAGSDSSLLLVAATTGVFGLVLYLMWLLSFLKTAKNNMLTNPLGLALLSSSVGILIHSQFVNSLFYPQLLMPLIFLFSLKYVQDL